MCPLTTNVIVPLPIFCTLNSYPTGNSVGAIPSRTAFLTSSHVLTAVNVSICTVVFTPCLSVTVISAPVSVAAAEMLTLFASVAFSSAIAAFAFASSAAAFALVVAVLAALVAAFAFAIAFSASLIFSSTERSATTSVLYSFPLATSVMANGEAFK